MASNKRQSGLTLTELLVVVAVMAVLLGISVPTAQHLMDSFESSTGVKHLVNAALSNARAIAVRNQAYAGVRFQEDADGNTYMTFIIHDKDATGLANGFRVVEGRKPMKLPEDVGILANVFSASNTDLQNDALIDTSIEMTDISTFSIVFTASGKLVTHSVRVRNKDGVTDNSSNDTIFNIDTVVDAGTAMFYQDDYGVSDTTNLGLGEEDSVQSILIYSKKELQAASDTSRWSDYLKLLQPDYISPYTGEIVMEYNDTP